LLPVGLRKTNICIPDVSSKNRFRLCYEYSLSPQITLNFSENLGTTSTLWVPEGPKSMSLHPTRLVARGLQPCCRLRVGRPANWAAIPGSSNRILCSETSVAALGPTKRPIRWVTEALPTVTNAAGGMHHIVKGKAIPLQAWTGPEGSRRLRLPDF